MRLKTSLMDSAKMRRTVIRLAHEMSVDSMGFSRIALVGIGARAEAIAKEIASVMQVETGSKVPVGRVDISEDKKLVCDETALGFSPSGAYVITVNDVLRSGHTAYIVNEAIAGAFSPQRMTHAAFVDCSGGNSLIKARYAGVRVDVDESDIVSVSVNEVDGARCVDVYSMD